MPNQEQQIYNTIAGVPPVAPPTPAVAPISSPVPSPVSSSPTTTGGVDKNAQILTLAIGKQEGGGKINYTQTGDSGKSAGAYQWNNGDLALPPGGIPVNFQSDAQKFGLNPNDFSPANQNQVAYMKVKSMLDSGMNPAQVASAWNAGEGEPNAYTGTFSNGQASTTQNFDVPGYTKGVLNYASDMWKSNQSQPQTSQTQSSDSQSSSPSVGGFLGNVLSSAGNVVSSLGNAVLHPIKTIEGIASIGKGGIEEAFGGTPNGDTQTFDNVVSYFKNRYGGDSLGQIVSNIGKTLYTDPVGAALDLSTLLDGAGAAIGAVGKVSDISRAADLAKAADYMNEAKNIVNGTTNLYHPPFDTNAAMAEALKTPGTLSRIGSTLSSAGDTINPLFAAGRGVSKLGGPLLTGVANTLGFTSEAGSGATRGAFEAGKAGGDSADAFKAGQAGVATVGDTLVDTATQAFKNIQNSRANDYQTALEGIKNAGTVLAPEIMQPVYDQFDALLKKFDVIKNDKGALDFSNSYLESEPGSITDIKQLNAKIEQFKSGAVDVNPVTLDKLKQNISDRFSPGTRGSAFTEALKGTVRTVLNKNVPDYEKMTSAYSEVSNDLKDIKQSLSLGGKAAKETVIKKLTSALSDKNPFRAEMLKALEDAGGVDITSQASGMALSRLGMPNDLRSSVEMIGAVVHPQLMAALLTASPKLVGKFMFYLGKGSAKLEKAGDILSSVKGPTILSALTEANQTQGTPSQ